jgi:hypothetical protein
MALKFEVNRLASDKLSYELEIRGIIGLATVAEMRKTLRNLLRLEKSPTPLTYPAHPYMYLRGGCHSSNPKVRRNKGFSRVVRRCSGRDLREDRKQDRARARSRE